jgi:hypothetical protein
MDSLCDSQSTDELHARWLSMTPDERRLQEDDFAVHPCLDRMRLPPTVQMRLAPKFVRHPAFEAWAILAEPGDPVFVKLFMLHEKAVRDLCRVRPRMAWPLARSYLQGWMPPFFPAEMPEDLENTAAWKILARASHRLEHSPLDYQQYSRAFSGPLASEPLMMFLPDLNDLPPIELMGHAVRALVGLLRDYVDTRGMPRKAIDLHTLNPWSRLFPVEIPR